LPRTRRSVTCAKYRLRVRVLNVPGLRDLAASQHGARFLVIAAIESVQERNMDVVAGWQALLDFD
jgi:hypothetical protein